MQPTNRAWRRWGISIPSAWNRSPILLQKLKLRTKSQIEFRLLELKLNRITKADVYSVSPTFAKPLVVRSPFFSVCCNVGLCPTVECCLCVGLVALLHFLSSFVCKPKMQMCYQKRWLLCWSVFLKVFCLFKYFYINFVSFHWWVTKLVKQKNKSNF